MHTKATVTILTLDKINPTENYHKLIDTIWYNVEMISYPCKYYNLMYMQKLTLSKEKI